MKVFPTSSSRSNPDLSFTNGAIVLYENNSSTILGAIVGSKKDKFKVLNNKGSEVDLPADRLYPLPGQIPTNLETQKEKASYLDKIVNDAETESQKIELVTIWESFEGQEKEVTVQQVCELFFGNNTLLNHLATRQALAKDKVYFKRKKDTFISRDVSTVETLLKAREVELQKEEERRRLISFFKLRLGNRSPQELPIDAQRPVSLLEDLSTGILEGPSVKEARDLLTDITDSLGLSFPGRPEDKAYHLLKEVGHYSDFTDLSIIKYRPRIEFPSLVSEEAAALARSSDLVFKGPRKDLTHLNIFTIDDASTKDMDDAISVETINGGFLLGIHITDAASILPDNSPLEREAKLRGTSIYCPQMTINMLPRTLSQERLSLREGYIVPAVSYLVTLNDAFEVMNYEIVCSQINVKARFNYSQVDALLMGADCEKVKITPQLATDLTLLHKITNKLEVDRIDNGAIVVSRRDVNVYVDDDSNIKLQEFDEASPARTLVGELMILANSISAEFCSKKNIPCVYRTQPESDVDPFSNPDNVPAGPALDLLIRMRLKRSSISMVPDIHSSLGLRLYTQVTSPIRRYLDLCVQRQIVSYLQTERPYYSQQALHDILIESETPLTNAKHLSQESKRFWLLKYLQQQLKNKPEVTVTVVRTDLKNPIVAMETVHLTVPINIHHKPKLGEVLKLRIAAIEPHRDYIRLEE